jgi:hypothetical protein
MAGRHRASECDMAASEAEIGGLLAGRVEHCLRHEPCSCGSKAYLSLDHHLLDEDDVDARTESPEWIASDAVFTT